MIKFKTSVPVSNMFSLYPIRPLTDFSDARQMGNTDILDDFDQSL